MVSWLLFIGVMFIGTGLGELMGRADVGAILGMGVGFILMAFVKAGAIEAKPIEVVMPRAISPRILRVAGAAILALVGVMFLLMGLSLYMFQQDQLREIVLRYAQYIGGSVLLLIGIAFIIGSATLARSK